MHPVLCAGMRPTFSPVRALKSLTSFNKKLQECMEYEVQKDQETKRYTALVDTEYCRTLEETSLSHRCGGGRGMNPSDFGKMTTNVQRAMFPEGEAELGWS